MMERWLCVMAPQLALQAVFAQSDPNRPQVLVAQKNRQSRVQDCNRIAFQHGVRVGQDLSLARALVPDLVTAEQDAAATDRLLRAMAMLGYQTSSKVALLEDAVVLEIAASHRVFSAPEIRAAMLQGARSLGLQVQLGVAFSPYAARVLAQSDAQAEDVSAQQKLLAGLPLENLALSAHDSHTLLQMGVTRIGQLQRLPTAGLKRRFGKNVLTALADLEPGCALREPLWQPPQRFDQAVELPSAVAHIQGLRFVFKRLLGELQHYVQATDRSIAGLRFTLETDEQPQTLSLAFRSASQDMSQWQWVLSEKLERLQLCGEVHTVHLTAEELLPNAPGQTDLFVRAERSEKGVEQWLERLTTRLGADHVQSLRPVADHRPERAWQALAGGSLTPQSDDCICGAVRPAWLLAQAAPIAPTDFQIISGPERLETGWWDGDDVRRDYFKARHQDGRTIWVYRQRKMDARWFIHGVFA